MGQRASKTASKLGKAAEKFREGGKQLKSKKPVDLYEAYLSLQEIKYVEMMRSADIDDANPRHIRRQSSEEFHAKDDALVQRFEEISEQAAIQSQRLAIHDSFYRTYELLNNNPDLLDKPEYRKYSAKAQIVADYARMLPPSSHGFEGQPVGMLTPLPRGAQARYETPGLTLPTLEQVVEEQKFEKEQALTRLKQLKYEERKRLAAPSSPSSASASSAAAGDGSGDAASSGANAGADDGQSELSGSSSDAPGTSDKGASSPPATPADGQSSSALAQDGGSSEPPSPDAEEDATEPKAITEYERALAIKELEDYDEKEITVSNRYVSQHLRPATVKGTLKIPFGEADQLDIYYEEKLGIELPAIRFGRDVAERGGAPPPVPKEYGALDHLPEPFGITESPNEFFPMRPPDVGPGDQLLYGGINEELLLEQGQLFEVFRKHRSDPEHYTAERLALEYDAPKEWIRLLLEYTTAPVFVRHEDDQTYGVWEVVDGAMTESEKQQVVLERRQVRAAADAEEEQLRLESAAGRDTFALLEDARSGAAGQAGGRGDDSDAKGPRIGQDRRGHRGRS